MVCPYLRYLRGCRLMRAPIMLGMDAAQFSWIPQLSALLSLDPDNHAKVLRLLLNQLCYKKFSNHWDLETRSSATAHVSGDHIPPHPSHIDLLMQRFEAWLNSDETLSLHPVRMAALAHYKLVIFGSHGCSSSLKMDSSGRNGDDSNPTCYSVLSIG